jgi:hypothetical protein
MLYKYNIKRQELKTLAQSAFSAHWKRSHNQTTFTPDDFRLLRFMSLKTHLIKQTYENLLQETVLRDENGLLDGSD